MLILQLPLCVSGLRLRKLGMSSEHFRRPRSFGPLRFAHTLYGYVSATWKSLISREASLAKKNYSLLIFCCLNTCKNSWSAENLRIHVHAIWRIVSRHYIFCISKYSRTIRNLQYFRPHKSAARSDPVFNLNMRFCGINVFGFTWLM